MGNSLGLFVLLQALEVGPVLTSQCHCLTNPVRWLRTSRQSAYYLLHDRIPQEQFWAWCTGCTTSEQSESQLCFAGLVHTGLSRLPPAGTKPFPLHTMC